jgi:UDP-glucose 6-dehydrogenase
MKQICIIGTGYVGLVTGACLGDLGNRAVYLEIDEAKIEKINQEIMPIYDDREEMERLGVVYWDLGRSMRHLSNQGGAQR